MKRVCYFLVGVAVVMFVARCDQAVSPLEADSTLQAQQIQADIAAKGGHSQNGGIRVVGVFTGAQADISNGRQVMPGGAEGKEHGPPGPNRPVPCEIEPCDDDGGGGTTPNYDSESWFYSTGNPNRIGMFSHSESNIDIHFIKVVGRSEAAGPCREYIETLPWSGTTECDAFYNQYYWNPGGASYFHLTTKQDSHNNHDFAGTATEVEKPGYHGYWMRQKGDHTYEYQSSPSSNDLQESTAGATFWDATCGFHTSC